MAAVQVASIQTLYARAIRSRQFLLADRAHQVQRIAIMQQVQGLLGMYQAPLERNGDGVDVGLPEPSASAAKFGEQIIDAGHRHPRFSSAAEVLHGSTIIISRAFTSAPELSL